MHTEKACYGCRGLLIRGVDTNWNKLGKKKTCRLTFAKTIFGRASFLLVLNPLYVLNLTWYTEKNKKNKNKIAIRLFLLEK